MIRDILFPPRCPICEEIVPKTGMTCGKCKNVLPYVPEPRCKKCSKQITDAESEYCVDCSRASHIFDSGKAVWNYDRKMAASIAKFKYHDKKEYGYFYAAEIVRLYGDWLKKMQIEALIPIPIHKQKQCLRGYNQAETIAVLLGKYLELPVLSSALVRVKNTRPQKELTSLERARNLEGAFGSGDNLPKGIKKVALIDDIYTTGSTMDACAKVLRDMNIEEIYFVCVCIGSNN